MNHDAHNPMFALAADFIHYSSKPVFLTGKAGTGKTTFLKYIRSNTVKQTAVVAPTGVAAINAGGVTIHSFFQLPFTPFLPSFSGNTNAAIDKHHLLGRIKLTRERRQVLQQLELLIIDEISMVRCDVLDAIDAVLKHFRNRYEPFGGVQVLFIGDMFQLPPVISNNEWQILRNFYDSQYFFDSKVLQQQQPVHIELNKIYRQNEPHFIELLNKVRNNEMDERGFDLLKERLNCNFQPDAKGGFVILTTHNYKADAVNAIELAKLEGETTIYKAKIEGDFSEKSYPADEILELKPGAQVMFIKNDKENVRRYFNGKIGVIKKLEEDVIHVECKDENDEIEVKKEVWQNLRFTINKQSQQVEEEVIGSFTQFPLRLAWAITIHKSQGLTFEKAVIDAGNAFAPGQVYVALSRCTSLSGIVLKSQISKHALTNDIRIVRFAQQKHSHDHLSEELQQAKKEYKSSVLKNIFEFEAVNAQMLQLMKVVDEHSISFNDEAKPWLEMLNQKLSEINETAKKFQPHLKFLLQKNIVPEQNTDLQQRVIAASEYFGNQLKDIIEILSLSPAVTDSKQYALAYNEEIKELHSLLAQKLHLIKSCENGFSVHTYHKQKNNFILSPLKVNAYATATAPGKNESPHPSLQKALRELRNAICEKENLPIYMVANSNTIDEMAEYLPQTKEELLCITGFGKAKAEKFGAQFLDTIIRYCKEKNLYSLIENKAPKHERKEKKDVKADTKEESYKLFKKGKTVSEIASERKLTTQTIEGHLAFYVQKGLIPIDELVAKEKLVMIEPVIEYYEEGSISPLKEKLLNDVSYGEIRLAIAWKNFQKQNATNARDANE